MTYRPKWFMTAVVIVIAVLLVAPNLIVIAMSFTTGELLAFPPQGFGTEWYQHFFTDPTWTTGAITSLKLACIVTVLATLLGTIAAFGLSRGHYPLKPLVQAVLLSPMIVPAVVIALGMYLAYSDWHISGTLPGLVAAHTCLAIPLVVINVMAGLQTFDRNLESAARNLGAGPVRTFWKVTLRMIMPSVLAGALFAFITSWDEIVIAIFLTSSVTRTLPVVMWGQVRSYIDPTIAAVASLLTGITILVFLIVAVLRMRQAKRATGA